MKERGIMNTGPNRTPLFPFSAILALLVLGFVLTGCGNREPAGPTPTPQPPVTPLSAAFKQPTTIIKAAEEATEGESEAATEAEAEAETPTPTAASSRGETIYTNRSCGDCHGAQGEGVADKGSALAGTALTAGEFETILRTGGQGALGNDHLYGPQAISPSGMEALYEFVVSLPTP
jgi:mono/diheme cytochrome c family protein